MPEFSRVLIVSALNGTNGFRLDGDASEDRAGGTVSGGGDVNGDGFADLLVAAPVSDTGGVDRGLAWVVFGAASSPASQGLAARVTAGTAYRFQGEAAGDQAGWDIANAGDVNGDGFDDMIIGASYADPDSAAGDRGASYLVFGGAAKLELLDAANGANDNLISLVNLTAATGFRFDGAADGDGSGNSVSGVGDVNGDGIADLLIGAPYANPDTGSDKGASYIVFGGTANLADLDNDDGVADGRIDLSQISPGQGLRLEGSSLFPGDRSGYAVALVGDVNGDGFDDALVGSRLADPNGTDTSEGAAYLVFGKSQADFVDSDGDAVLDGTIEIAVLDGLAGTRFDGVAAGDDTGSAVSGLGDVNGDGFADIVIGAKRAEPAGTLSGAAFVVFGKDVFGASSDLSALNGANGFRINGLRAGDDTGVSVSGAGDLNGDGFADILIGAKRFDRLGADDAGAAYVVFGKASGFAAVVDLSSLNGDTGFRIEGAAGDNYLGGSAAAAGDVNGDGFDDIIVGASRADNNALTFSGSAYIIYGHRADTAVTRTGTALDNTMNGGKGDDTISGLSGNDKLFGWENDDLISGGDGVDIIDGGAGEDTISGGGGADTLTGGGDTDFLNGGSGVDTASYATSVAGVVASLDGSLTAAGDAAFDTFVSIERLTGSNAVDQLRGNHLNNRLAGLNGNDTLEGMTGNDIIVGGAGADTLAGGLDNDVFDYDAITDSTVAVGGRDTISDFNASAADRIDASTIDAIAGGANNAFVFIGGGAFTALGQIRAVASGPNTLVEFNTTGTNAADMQILLTGAVALDAADFVL